MYTNSPYLLKKSLANLLNYSLWFEVAYLCPSNVSLSLAYPVLFDLLLLLAYSLWVGPRWSGSAVPAAPSRCPAG